MTTFSVDFGDVFSYLIAMADAFHIRLSDSGSETVLFQFTSSSKDKVFAVCCSFLADTIYITKNIFS